MTYNAYMLLVLPYFPRVYVLLCTCCCPLGLLRLLFAWEMNSMKNRYGDAYVV